MYFMQLLWTSSYHWSNVPWWGLRIIPWEKRYPISYLKGAFSNLSCCSSWDNWPTVVGIPQTLREVYGLLICSNFTIKLFNFSPQNSFSSLSVWAYMKWLYYIMITYNYAIISCYLTLNSLVSIVLYCHNSIML